PVIVRARRAGCGRRRRPAGLSVSMLLTPFLDGWLRAIIESESPSILGTGSNPALIARPNRERHMPATSQSTRQPRVLVVDDEEHITELVAMGLTYNGFEVERVGSGRSALEAVERRKPDLIVLDVML